jgi:hypothetical protein
MTLIIEPYEAVGPLQFGMSHDAIVATMGEPEWVTKNYHGNPELWYDHMSVVMEGGCFVEVGFAPDIPVSICGIRPFAEPDAFARLCKLDGSPLEVHGFIIFRELGITLTGFHDNDESQKALTAFARGRWDVFEAEMKPFHIQSSVPGSLP